MSTYEMQGKALRESAKLLVLEFMSSTEECASNSYGLPQAIIGRACGLNFGEKEHVSASHQNHWIAALLWELHEESKVQRDLVTKKWRLK